MNTTANISLLIQPYRVENFASVNFRQTGKESVNPYRMTFRFIEIVFSECIFGVYFLEALPMRLENSHVLAYLSRFIRYMICLEVTCF